MIGAWLLAPAALAELETAYQAAPPAAEIAAFASRTPPSPLTVSNGVGSIDVSGVLTERPSLYAILTGGGNTAYVAIREAVQQAEANPEVREIVFSVNSPGGSVDGLFETLAVIEAAKKPRRVRATMAASAAYAVAAVAGHIEAAGPAASFGSVGVVATMSHNPNLISVTSSNAPNKRPDISTEAGRAVVRAELDQIEDLFIEAIAKGRGVTPATVRTTYGRGSVVLARKAVDMKMADSISTGSSSTTA